MTSQVNAIVNPLILIANGIALAQERGYRAIEIRELVRQLKTAEYDDMLRILDNHFDTDVVVPTNLSFAELRRR